MTERKTCRSCSRKGLPIVTDNEGINILGWRCRFCDHYHPSTSRGLQSREQLAHDLAQYENGQYVPMPVSPAHATAMILIAERYLGEHPDD